MDHHLDSGEPDGGGNARNGYGVKTVPSDTATFEIAVPRDRLSTFDPPLIAKYQRRFPDFDEKIISVYARHFDHDLGVIDRNGRFLCFAPPPRRRKAPEPAVTR